MRLQTGELVAALSTMTMCVEFWSVSSSERKKLKRLCDRLWALGIGAFPCHGQHHAVVFCQRQVDGRVGRMSPAELSAALEADPRLLVAFEGAMGREGARAWGACHREAFPGRGGHRYQPWRPAEAHPPFHGVEGDSATERAGRLRRRGSRPHTRANRVGGVGPSSARA